MSEHETNDDDAASWPERLEQMAATEPDSRRVEMRRLADATRRLLHGLVMTDADEDTLRWAADGLDEIADAFHDPRRRSVHEGFTEAATSGDPNGFFEHSPLLGRSNPLAPPIDLSMDADGAMVGTAVFGAGYEGPPGCVHGGYIAASFDEILGAAQTRSGQPGMTGTLTVRYRSPTPLHEEVRLRGVFERVEGRKIFTSGTLHAGDRLCAEAEGIFISVDFARLAELRAERDAD